MTSIKFAKRTARLLGVLFIASLVTWGGLIFNSLVGSQDFYGAAASVAGASELEVRIEQLEKVNSTTRAKSLGELRAELDKLYEDAGLTPELKSQLLAADVASISIVWGVIGFTLGLSWAAFRFTYLSRLEKEK